MSIMLDVHRSARWDPMVSLRDNPWVINTCEYTFGGNDLCSHDVANPPCCSLVQRRLRRVVLIPVKANIVSTIFPCKARRTKPDCLKFKTALTGLILGFSSY